MSPPAWFHAGALRESLGYGAQIQASNILNFGNYRLSFYLLNVFISIREVGQYSVALTLLQPVLLISTAVQYVLFPKVSLADAAAANVLMPRLLRQMTWAMLSAFALLALVSRPLVLICYGAEYAGSVRPLQVLILGGIFLSLATILSAYNCGRGRPEIPIYSSGLALALTAGLGWWLIPRYGMLGAAWTSVGACAGLMAVELLGYLRLSGNRMSESLLMTSADVREAMLAIRNFLKGPLGP
jgi:O-antigen/teichoic acid export membrane protein